MKYRKKPVVIEAWQLTQDNVINLYEKIHKVDLSTIALHAHAEVLEEVTQNKGLMIPTLEGNMLASFGDYIIKGIQGEYYPCKPDIFEQTYEKVE